MNDISEVFVTEPEFTGMDWSLAEPKKGTDFLEFRNKFEMMIYLNEEYGSDGFDITYVDDENWGDIFSTGGFFE